MITNKKLDFWVKNNLNVLITGEHGVGKTAVVEETFKRHNLRYLYFSAGTMDPFVDLIGVPREKTAEHTDEAGLVSSVTYLDLLRPLPFATDSVDAIFMDELNRASDKVRNAVMEIIQKKSINGKKFHNLRFIWAAVNPEDDAHTYDVERLDPAQKDRFHIHTSIDYKPDKKYFYGKFGEKIAKSAIEWWDNITPVELKKLCSPRRLDYALDISLIGGDLKDVLPSKLNISRLADLLQNGLAREKLVRLLNDEDYDGAEKLLLNENAYTEIERWFTNDETSLMYRADIFRLLHSERIAKLISSKKYSAGFLEPLYNQFYVSDKITDVLVSIIKTTGDKLVRESIYKGIPSLHSDETGKNPILMKPTKNATTAFSTEIKNMTANEIWSKPDTKFPLSFDKYKFILSSESALGSIPANLSKDDANFVVKIVHGFVRHMSLKDILALQTPLFGVLNYCLQITGIDMRNDPFYKIEMNNFIRSKTERYLWTPTQIS